MAQGHVGRLKPTLIGIAAALAVALAGGAMTEIGPWYESLRKPWFQPPDWLFGPAWTLIYALCVVSGVTAWRAAEGRGAKNAVITLFLVNAILNVSWSLLFFTLRRPDWAFVEVIFLWASIVALIAVLWRISRLSSLVLLPYLAWVTFAAVLNRAVVDLNGPFG